MLLWWRDFLPFLSLLVANNNNNNKKDVIKALAGGREERRDVTDELQHLRAIPAAGGSGPVVTAMSCSSLLVLCSHPPSIPCL